MYKFYLLFHFSVSGLVATFSLSNAFLRVETRCLTLARAHWWCGSAAFVHTKKKGKQHTHTTHTQTVSLGVDGTHISKANHHLEGLLLGQVVSLFARRLIHVLEEKRSSLSFSRSACDIPLWYGHLPGRGEGTFAK